MENRKIDRFVLYLKKSEISISFAEKLAGLGSGTLRKCMNKETGDLTKPVLNSLLSTFKDLNSSWLLTGNGEMLNKSGETWPTLDDVGNAQQTISPDRSFIIEQIIKERENINKALSRIDELLMLIK